MAKRKSSKKLTKKVKSVLDKEFNCLFCNHENSISVRIRDGLGTLNCKACGVNFQSTTNKLSENIDVYSDWVDAVEGMAAGTTTNNNAASAAASNDTDDDIDNDPDNL